MDKFPFACEPDKSDPDRFYLIIKPHEMIRYASAERAFSVITYSA